MTADKEWLSVSYGGGDNSFALVLGLRERGIRPDTVHFSDTGGELPHTYEHVLMMESLLQVWWGVKLHIVWPTLGGERISLEQDCLTKGMLPSISYGHRSCSQRAKHEPLEKSLVQLARAEGVTRIRKAIGYHALEPGRGKNVPPSKQLSKDVTETYWYPLREWGWGPEECIATIKRHGYTPPGKSSCFFCAARRPSEVLEMRNRYPDHLKRALAMETKAQARHTSEIGLGGSGNFWAQWLANDAAQMKLMLDIEPVHLPCDCTS